MTSKLKIAKLQLYGYQIKASIFHSNLKIATEYIFNLLVASNDP